MMPWTWFAALQVILILFGLCVVMVLHNRTLRKQAREQEAEDDLLGLYEGALTGDGPAQKLIQLILSDVRSPQADFADGFEEKIEACGFERSEPEALETANQRIAELEAELANAGEAEGDSGEVSSQELKELLKKYTQDSREMLGCIQTLEAENAALKAELDALREDSPPDADLASGSSENEETTSAASPS